jgi:hypothetical protein
MYKSLIINLIGESVENGKKIIDTSISKYISQVDEEGTIWVITKNYPEKGRLVFSSFILAESMKKFKLKNIILVPDFDNKSKGVIFDNNTFEILFFSKNEKYYFNKDPIREKHIWKNVEWGKRAKNYHPLGKDPGNVWLKTQDDGKGNITEHITVSFKESVERIIKSSSEEKDRCLLININQDIESFGREVEFKND